MAKLNEKYIRKCETSNNSNQYVVKKIVHLQKILPSVTPSQVIENL